MDYGKVSCHPPNTTRRLLTIRRAPTTSPPHLSTRPLPLAFLLAEAPEGSPHDHALRLVERPGPVPQPPQPAAQPERCRGAVRPGLNQVLPGRQRTGHGGAQPRVRGGRVRPSLRG